MRQNLKKNMDKKTLGETAIKTKLITPVERTPTDSKMMTGLHLSMYIRTL